MKTVRLHANRQDGYLKVVARDARPRAGQTLVDVGPVRNAVEAKAVYARSLGRTTQEQDARQWAEEHEARKLVKAVKE